MKTFLTGLFLVFSFFTAITQPNCNAPSSGFTPINDLKTNTFLNAWNQEWQGGLYLNGSNFIPELHKQEGLKQASLIQCFNHSGFPDPVSGKIVWLSIGMSNTTQETQQFISLANSYAGRNPKLAFVDGAQGGMTAAIISSPWNANYSTFWTTVNKRLENSNLTSAQVQVIWLKEADVAGNIPIRNYYDSLVVRLKRIAREIKIRFPNCRICYLSGRISGRYATSTLNPEPYAYYSGWAIRKVIEDQIKGDKSLQYSGTQPLSPWLAWGRYFWTDGNIPQISNPSFSLQCPADFQNDGTHPSTTGARKVAENLLNFFTTDSTSVPWFLGKGCNPVAQIEYDNIDARIRISFDENARVLILRNDSGIKNATMVISNANGQMVKRIKNISGKTFHCNCGEFAPGLYIVSVKEITGEGWIHKMTIRH